MTEKPVQRRRRSRVSENAQPIETYQPSAPVQEYGYEMQQPDEGYAQQPFDDQPQYDYSAYYSREGSDQEAAQSAFAAPVHLHYQGYDEQPWDAAPAEESVPGNVYRPREVTWADEDREEAIAQSGMGYQVHADALPQRKRRKRCHTLRNLLIVLLVLALLAGAAWFLREPIMAWLKTEEILPEVTETPVEVVVTPQPIKAYEAAPAIEMADSTGEAIRNLTGSLKLDHHIITDTHVVERHLRADGTYDFYLFTAPKGRLLCYFEGLGPQDMIPQEGGGFYVAQEPWLLTSGGSALVRTSSIEAAIGESVFLHPMYRGWAVVESEEDGTANYVNANGQMISALWFSRTFPFIGDHTLAYADTGSTADADQRYLLYVLNKDGTMNRWLATADMTDVTIAVCGMAYMKNGDLYKLPDTAAPLFNTRRVDAYLDCDAMVVQDPRTGKYALLVQGEQHYDFAYDSIRPVESDIVWAEKTLGNANAAVTVHAVSGAGYPQPLSYSFVLEKDGQREYVALSASSSCPIRLDGEF